MFVPPHSGYSQRGILFTQFGGTPTFPSGHTPADGVGRVVRVGGVGRVGRLTGL